MSVSLVEREVEVAGTRVPFRTAGEGPPLVLVHGLAGSSRWWTPVLPALSARHTVVLVDLPGFGALARGPRVALDDAATWLLAWLEAAELDRPALVGHSMGGAIAIRAAAVRPKSLDRLVLAAPAGVLGRHLLGYGLPLALAVMRMSPRLAWVLGLDALRAGPRTLLGASLEVAGADVRAELRRVAVPTLVVVGGRDPIVPPRVGDAVREELPSAELVVLEGAGHVPMYDRPAAFAGTLLAFLER